MSPMTRRRLVDAIAVRRSSRRIVDRNHAGRDVRRNGNARTDRRPVFLVDHSPTDAAATTIVSLGLGAGCYAARTRLPATAAGAGAFPRRLVPNCSAAGDQLDPTLVQPLLAALDSTPPDP